MWRCISYPIPIVLAWAVSCAAQEPSFRSHVEIVVVPCTVVDESGAAVTGLSRDEFRVYDNNVPRTIQNLWTDADAPLTLGVIIDVSESQEEQVAEHRQTVVDLFDRVLRPGDREFVISAGQEVRLWADVTSNAQEIRERISDGAGPLFGEPCPKRASGIPEIGPWSSCGASPLWNAIYDAARIKLEPVKGNKALVILTDGFDSGSTHAWSDAAKALGQAGAALYAIQYRSGLGSSFAPDLFRLVLETGGTRFPAPRGDYTGIVSRLETDLRHRYVLGFRPEMLSGKVRHDLRIEVARPNLTVRAQKAYFREAR